MSLPRVKDETSGNVLHRMLDAAKGGNLDKWTQTMFQVINDQNPTIAAVIHHFLCAQKKQGASDETIASTTQLALWIYHLLDSQSEADALESLISD